MSPENLQKSIILTGPPCVGKSLIGAHLSKKLDMPIFSIDDMLLLINEEISAGIGPTPKQQKRFIKDLKQQILESPEDRELLSHPDYVETEEQLLKNFVDLYNGYRETFGDLKCFYTAVKQNLQTLSSAQTMDYIIASLAHVSNQMIEIIISKLDQPVIIDAPGCYGWQFVKHLELDTKIKLARNLNMRPTEAEKQMNSTIASMQSVLIVPGPDYETRTTDKAVTDNFLVEHVDDYIDTDLVISANELFYPTKTKYLRQRKLADAREYLEKEKLKNKAEITNICEQIIDRLNDLQSCKTL